MVLLGLGLETSGLGLEAFGLGLETPGLVNIPESKHILTNELPYSRQTVHSMYRQQLVSTPYHTIPSRPPWSRFSTNNAETN